MPVGGTNPKSYEPEPVKEDFSRGLKAVKNRVENEL